MKLAHFEPLFTIPNAAKFVKQSKSDLESILASAWRSTGPRVILLQALLAKISKEAHNEAVEMLAIRGRHGPLGAPERGVRDAESPYWNNLPPILERRRL